MPARWLLTVSAVVQVVLGAWFAVALARARRVAAG
jgi:hypothetical protein